ncbi:MAG TPA: hypothetical protein VN549_08050 [Negativicutes bacterium]|nr:hypothetical protein [Negativicutes bacterium]
MANAYAYGGTPIGGAESAALYTGNFYQLLSRYIGETVTIFTTSGGESGAGFTGVILFVDPCFLRLVTHIGPAPGCALGNGCDGVVMGGYGGGNVRTVGSVTEIPLDRIAAFVHSAI